jgi:ribosomal protein S18 acetylase RimI-like enzyme
MTAIKTIKRLDHSDLRKIAEIDRSEHITLNYVYNAGTLDREEVDIHAPRWPASGSWGFEERIRHAERRLKEGGENLGAFDGDLLVGYATLRHDLEPGTAQLDSLYVSRDYRRQGIASRLTAEVIRLAQEQGAERLYVSATPSGSAVGFYQSHGFRLVEKVNAELYALEPEDIHMIRSL